MNIFKDCNVVILFTNKASHIRVAGNNGKLIYKDEEAIYLPYVAHLYITSDEKLEEGDWCITPDNHPCIFGYDFRAMWSKKQILSCKKIIASTDSSIKIVIPRHNDFDSIYNFPKIPQTFIDYFISEYNKGNKIEKTQVEYEIIRKGVSSGQDCIFGYICSDTITEESLKVNPDNTINIRTSKDNWNREEVSLNISNFAKDFSLANNLDFSKSLDFTTNWIKQNL